MMSNTIDETKGVCCKDCRYFISCESGKQIFHKLTETPCNEFKECDSREIKEDAKC